MSAETNTPNDGLKFDAEDRRALLTTFIGALIIIPVAAWVFGGVNGLAQANWTFHPDFSVLARAPLWVKLHLLAAGVTATAAATILSLRKGTSLHKVAGRFWAAVIVGTAISGLLIDVHRFTPAHGAALLVFFMVPLAIWRVRTGDLRGHRRTVMQLMIAFVIVAALAFLPGHLLHGVFFGP
ncbi:MAG: DUF2306 domain-containing protein [Alphaproteobacteria bacterium]